MSETIPPRTSGYTACILCGGRGVLRAADVYTSIPQRQAVVVWELGRIIACDCRYREATS